MTIGARGSDGPCDLAACAPSRLAGSPSPRRDETRRLERPPHQCGGFAARRCARVTVCRRSARCVNTRSRVGRVPAAPDTRLLDLVQHLRLPRRLEPSRALGASCKARRVGSGGGVVVATHDTRELKVFVHGRLVARPHRFGNLRLAAAGRQRGVLRGGEGTRQIRAAPRVAHVNVRIDQRRREELGRAKALWVAAQSTNRRESNCGPSSYGEKTAAPPLPQPTGPSITSPG